MAGYPHMTEALYGAGGGYFDVSDVETYGGGPSHTSFVVWLVVLTVGAAAVLGGLKFLGFHFVVKT